MSHSMCMTLFRNFFYFHDCGMLYLLFTLDADFGASSETYLLGPNPGLAFSPINIERDEIIEEEEGFITYVDILDVPPNTVVQFVNRTTLIRIAAGKDSYLHACCM